MRQRRGLREEEAGGPIDGEDEKERRARAREQEQQMAPYLVGGVILIMVVIVGILLWTHPHIEFHKRPPSKQDLSREEVLTHLQNHTVLHIGGLHRSGTTLLADVLTKHPSVAGLMHQPGADMRKAHWIKKVFNEGIFLQSVYPKFGLDHEKFLLKKWIGQAAKKILPEGWLPWTRLREGVGRYALHPQHHLDDSSNLIRPRAQVHLFSEWALFWDLSRPVLLEKSPSNVVISPFLHRLWGLGVAASPAKFLFVQRHPIPVAIATSRRGGAMVSDLTIADLVENWVAAEERRAKDVQSYFDYYEFGKDVYRVVELEDVLQEPRKVLQSLLRWLNLEESEELLRSFEEKVRPDQNVQYFKLYCDRLVRGGKDVLDEHHRLVQRFRQRVLAVSRYDLATIPQICREVLLGPSDGAALPDNATDIEDALEKEEAVEAGIVGKDS